MSNHSLYRNWCSSPGSCGLGVRGWRRAAGGMIQGEPHSRGGRAVSFPVHAGVRWLNAEIGFIAAERLWEPQPEMRGD